ncbi:MAG: hypothetical protein J7L42_05180, partial [Elusimicrobia bacterium]|nr:hypothetical protein [Elusimicrobiota bacterium]
LTLKNDIFKIKINPDFVKRYAFTPYRFAALLLHEVLHHFFEHFKEVESFTDITANIAQDAIINSVIDSLLPGLSELFKDLYSPERFPEKFLRPGSVIDNEKWDETIWYLKLWSPPEVVNDICLNYFRTKRIVKIPIVDRSGEDFHISCWRDLKNFFDMYMGNKKIDIFLLGSHGIDGGHSDRQVTDFIVRATASELLNAIRTSGKGFSSGDLMDYIIINYAETETKKVNVSPLKYVFERVLINTFSGKVAKSVYSPAPDRTVLPSTNLSRRELALLGGGIYPVFFRNLNSRQQFFEVAIYIDVSGSLYDEIPFIYKLINTLERYVSTNIFLFSDEVVRIKKSELKQGLVRTSYGTNFDNVCYHILGEEKIKKAVIITDGFSSVQPELAKQVYKKKEMYAVIIKKGIENVINWEKSEIELKKFCRKIFYYEGG